ncbi:hypothetical protein FCL40_01050 [Ferrimonas sediminicola]|uniref:Outer membrane protein (Porin) n=1 Tax=Ferrimonas sediminicola TaxID=2569538 RepID=A0A4U1BK39_9GAMM|nr:hypothetical protein [Ferrimonas sediminicola]TKB51174.1 hypothetical protein FCL40_01050 [Ferrimonas sediminicola]
MFRCSTLAACLSIALSPAAMAGEAPTFNLFGDIQGQGIWQSGAGSTFNAEAKSVNLGGKGKYAVKDITTYYTLSAQYSDNFDDIEVRNASLYFSTKYGGFYVGKGASGSYANVYARTDIHANNNNDPSGKNRMLYEQGMYTDNTFCYVSPKWATESGTWQMKAAIVTYNEVNEASDDALMGRLLYSKGGFNAVLNYLRFDENAGPEGTEKAYNRFAAGADYTIENLTLAATVEITDNSFNGAENTYAGAVVYSMNEVDFGVSYQHKTFETDLDDLGLVIASLKYHYGEQLTFYVEAAEYTEDTADYANFSGNRFANSDDNFAVGAIFKF